MNWKKNKHDRYKTKNDHGTITHTTNADGQQFSVYDTGQNCFCISLNGETVGYAPDLLTAFRTAEALKEAKYTRSEREEFTYNPYEGLHKN